MVDARHDFEVGRVEMLLPGARNGEHDVTADEFGPVKVIAIGGRQQPSSVPRLVEDLVSVLHTSYARPIEGSRRGDQPLLFCAHFHPVVEPTDHQGAHGNHLNRG